MTDTKFIAAAQKLQVLGYEWKGDEWTKPAPPIDTLTGTCAEFIEPPRTYVSSGITPNVALSRRTRSARMAG